MNIDPRSRLYVIGSTLVLILAFAHDFVLGSRQHGPWALVVYAVFCVVAGAVGGAVHFGIVRANDKHGLIKREVLDTFVDLAVGMMAVGLAGAVAVRLVLVIAGVGKNAPGLTIPDELSSLGMMLVNSALMPVGIGIASLLTQSESERLAKHRKTFLIIAAAIPPVVFPLATLFGPTAPEHNSGLAGGWLVASGLGIGWGSWLARRFGRATDEFADAASADRQAAQTDAVPRALKPNIGRLISRSWAVVLGLLMVVMVLGFLGRTAPWAPRWMCEVTESVDRVVLDPLLGGDESTPNRSRGNRCDGEAKTAEPHLPK